MKATISQAVAADVRVISADEALPLRQTVLRPGRPIATAQFPGDHAAATRHYGAFRGGQLLGIASLYVAALPEQPDLAARQLRGMATAPGARGMGFGRALVLACADFARLDGAGLLWCNARTSAVGFYRRMGFEILGDEFEIPDVGPHVRMKLRLGEII